MKPNKVRLIGTVLLISVASVFGNGNGISRNLTISFPASSTGHRPIIQKLQQSYRHDIHQTLQLLNSTHSDTDLHTRISKLEAQNVLLLQDIAKLTQQKNQDFLDNMKQNNDQMFSKILKILNTMDTAITELSTRLSVFEARGDEDKIDDIVNNPQVRLFTQENYRGSSEDYNFGINGPCVREEFAGAKVVKTISGEQVIKDPTNLQKYFPDLVEFDSWDLYYKGVVLDDSDLTPMKGYLFGYGGFPIPLKIGGPANETFNTFPQTPAGAAEWSERTAFIPDCMRAHPGKDLWISVVFMFQNERATRPYLFTYRIRCALKVFYGIIRN
ncbi:unnamed protein product [Allacma fusca]|uniref:Uncharacterized protein n=1 Tax=Allacma fusca TaxID=39272 RepID=A0A8J2PX16_9HEXA|nr:unnamed protein product [Allacma fusca]